MTEYLFHSGPLKTEYFGGHSYWTRNPDHAGEYGEDGQVWVIEIALDQETLADEDDYLPPAPDNVDDMPYWYQNDDAWHRQTQAILAAVAEGATVVASDDGLCIVNAERFNPRLVSLDEAKRLLDSQYA